MMADYYKKLGVGIDATKAELQQAIEAFTAQSNPKEIKTIKETLLVETSRANYDMLLRQNYPSRYPK